MLAGRAFSRCTTPSANRHTASPTTGCSSGPLKVKAGSCRSVAWTQPKRRLRGPKAAPPIGARGIKLHPRAQDFKFDGPEMEEVFALAEMARVPILIHAGRGLPPLADGLADLALRHPGAVLILAHGAICDQGILTSRLAEHPGVLYDISCFFPLDVIELLARAPIERIVFASDPPYGLPASSLYLALRVAAHAGLDEAAIRGMLGGTIAGLFDGHGLPAVNPPRRGDSITLSGRLARVYGYGSL